MAWTNIGLTRIKNKTADNFTTNFGIKLRRWVFPLTHFAIRHAVNMPYEIKKYPKLDKGKSYIFAAGHSFPEEAASNLAAIDRNAWVLAGTTDQVDHNPRFYFLWVNGIIFVDKYKADLRVDAFRKMKRIIENGSSIILYPEGGFNNSETAYCAPLYPGVYHLAKETECEVVPIVSEQKYDLNCIYIGAGEPIDFSNKGRDVAMDELRDALSTIRYELCQKETVKRKTLKGDLHLEHMKNRLDTYLETKWVNPDWEEELMVYSRSGETSYQEAFGQIENVEITKENARIIMPIMKRLQEIRRYDLKQYMKENWEKRQREIRG